MSLSNSTPNGELIIDMVKKSLLNERIRRKPSSQNEANVVEKQYRGRSKSENPHNRDKSIGRSKSQKDMICWYCDKSGHKKSECEKCKHDQKTLKGTGNKEKPKKEEQDITTAVATNDIFFIRDYDRLKFACKDSSWNIDSGASHHLTSHSDFFSTYVSGDFGSVRMGNDGSCKIIVLEISF